MSRYYVDTEHIRGEPRIYWVADRKKPSDSPSCGKMVSDATTNKRKIERLCDKMNAAEGDVA